MKVQITKTTLAEILSFRNLFLAENNFQIRYNACHERGWSDAYLINVDGRPAGYGAVKGKDDLKDRDTAFEFYVIPSYRSNLDKIFAAFLADSGAAYIECQTNDKVMCSMINIFTDHVAADVILFEEDRVTTLKANNAIFRPRKEGENYFEHQSEPDGPFVVETDGHVVATGGFLLHYNKPFADLYMEVHEKYRQMGFGSFLIQEIKKECYLAGRVPAARCNINNPASKATLLKAGLRIAGFMQIGKVRI